MQRSSVIIAAMFALGIGACDLKEIELGTPSSSEDEESEADSDYDNGKEQPDDEDSESEPDSDSEFEPEPEPGPEPEADSDSDSLPDDFDLPPPSPKVLAEAHCQATVDCQCVELGFVLFQDFDFAACVDTYEFDYEREFEEHELIDAHVDLECYRQYMTYFSGCSFIPGTASFTNEVVLCDLFVGEVEAGDTCQTADASELFVVDSDNCRAGLGCLDGSCRPPGQEGEECSTREGAGCEDGLACLSGACIATVGLSEPCTSEVCDDGLFCSDSVVRSCEPLLAPGATCIFGEECESARCLGNGTCSEVLPSICSPSTLDEI